MNQTTNGNSKPGGLVGFLSTTAAMYSVCIGVLGLLVTGVSGYYNMQDRLTNLQSTVDAMLAKNIASRVQTLEEEEHYDSGGVTSDMSAVAQREAAQEQEIHDITQSIAGISNQLATISTQMTLVINHNIQLPIYAAPPQGTK